MARATRLPLAKLRPGTPKTRSSAEKSDAKMRREVQASRSRPASWKRSARSTNVRSASSDALVHVDHHAAEQEQACRWYAGVERAHHGHAERDQEDQQRQQRQQRVVRDGGRAVGAVVVLEAHEGAPGRCAAGPCRITAAVGAAAAASRRGSGGRRRACAAGPATAPATSSRLQHPASASRASPGIAAEARVDGAGGDGRDLHALLADLEHQAGREVVEGGLARAVGGHARDRRSGRPATRS